MIFVKTINRNDLSEYRMLVIAIAASLAWHIFCLSAVKIVSGPEPKSTVKYSKVAFLGPILSTVSMEVRAAPAGRSFLETRFRDIAERASYSEEAPAIPPDLKFNSRSTGDITDRRLSAVIDGAVSGDKFEPDFPAE